MRLRAKQTKQYHLKKQFVKKDKEGSSYVEYGDPFAFLADISPAGGKVQAELYGVRLAYMLNMVCTEDIDIKENDGICVYVDAQSLPDYKVISIKRYSNHILCELEKI